MVGKQKELLVIIPAYNEEKNIPRVFRQLRMHRVEEIADILIIDDASADATARIVEKESCILIRNICRMGYANSLLLGYRYAMYRNYHYVIQMDADGQHDACNIPVIYRKLLEKDEKGHCPDLVLASRFMEGCRGLAGKCSVFIRISGILTTNIRMRTSFCRCFCLALRWRKFRPLCMRGQEGRVCITAFRHAGICAGCSSIFRRLFSG